MKLKRALVTAVGAALIAAPTVMPVTALANEGTSEAVVLASQGEQTGYKLDIRDVTINASQLKSNLLQLKMQLRALMIRSATYNGTDISDRIDLGFGDSAGDLLNKRPGTYTIHFTDGNEIATATLTVTDSAAAAAPALTEDTVASTSGGLLLTVMGQGVTDQPNKLPAGSFTVGSVRQGPDGTQYTDVTINSAAIDKYYKPLVPPVVWNKVTWNQAASNLTATFKWDADTQAWTVETPAKVTFNVTTDQSTDFEFADSATLAPSDVKDLSTRDLIALIKEKLVKKAEVNGESVIDAYDFQVMLGTQLNAIQSGTPGSYEIGFMYNNKQIGSATLVIAESEQPTQPGTTTPGTGEPGDNGTSDAEDDATGEAGSNEDASAKKDSDKKDDEGLPKTGDASSAAGILASLGAAISALGIASSRLRKRF